MKCSIQNTAERLAGLQKVAILLMKGGERHHLKLIAVEGEILVGEARCLYHNYDIGKKIHLHALEEEKNVTYNSANGVTGLTMADAVDKFGAEAHRYRFHIPIDEIGCIVEDIDDAFDETPFFSSLL